MKKEVIWILYSFIPSLDVQSEFDQKKCHKKAVPLEHSYLKYALVHLLSPNPIWSLVPLDATHYSLEKDVLQI